jgi:serine protease
MVRRAFPILCGFVFFLLAGCSGVTQSEKPQSFKEAIVYLEHPASEAEIAQIDQQYGIQLRPNSKFSTDHRLFRFTYAEADAHKAKAFLDQLTASEVIQYAEPNYTYKSLGFPNDPLYPQQWNLRAINVEKAWNTANGEGAVVAVIDTGVSANLPDMGQTDFVRGYDFVNDDDDASDDQGHGSHVAGTIAQSTDNGEGVAGIAYAAKIMPIKVLDSYGSGSLADVAEGIKLAADRGANIINLSLGGGGDSQLMRDAVNYANSKGVVVICAAGNEDSPSSIYPALYPGCLSVAAFGPSGKRSFFSNYGRGVDISAPGGDKTNGAEGGILQNTIDESGNSVYASYQGTSMAAPHVAGVAALLWSRGMHDPSMIRKALLSSARTAGDDVRNDYGAGRLDAGQAMDIVDQPYVFWRGGVSWMVPLSTLVVGGFLGFFALRIGNGAEPLNDTTYALGFMVMGLGIVPLQAIGTLWGPEGMLALLSTPIPQWDTLFFEGMFNPILHSILLPGLFALLLGRGNWERSFAIGAAIGTASLLTLQATVFFMPLNWFPLEEYSRYYLLANAAGCVLLAFFAHKLGRSAAQ